MRTFGQYLVEEFGFTVSRFFSQLDHVRPQTRVFNWHARGNPQDPAARIARYGAGADKAWGWPADQLQHGERRDFVFDVVPADVDLAGDPWWAEDLKFVRGAWAKMQSLEPRGVPQPTPQPPPVQPPSQSSLEVRVEELRSYFFDTKTNLFTPFVALLPGNSAKFFLPTYWPTTRVFMIAGLRLYRALAASGEKR